LREKTKRLSNFSLCSEHLLPFPLLCPFSSIGARDAQKHAAKPYRGSYSIIFIQLLYIAPVCAKRLRVWASIHCVVSNFYFFTLVCPASSIGARDAQKQVSNLTEALT